MGRYRPSEKVAGEEDLERRPVSARNDRGAIGKPWQDKHSIFIR